MTEDKQNFTTSFVVEQSPHEVFEAVTDVCGWWSGTIVGGTAKLNDEFTFEVKGVHYSKQRLIEVVPDQKVVWLVTEAKMTFIKQEDEWAGTKVVFEISRQGDKTKLTFTHVGLVPEVECYGACMPAWTQYVQHSLFKLITTGTGDPNLEGRTIEQPPVVTEQSS
jgi:hypothetical protein